MSACATERVRDSVLLFGWDMISGSSNTTGVDL